MKIPEIKPGIAASVSINFTGAQKNSNWPIEMIAQLKANKQDVLAEFLIKAAKQFGEKASLVGLVVYKMIESQMEADELKELIG